MVKIEVVTTPTFLGKRSNLIQISYSLYADYLWIIYRFFCKKIIYWLYADYLQITYRFYIIEKSFNLAQKFICFGGKKMDSICTESSIVRKMAVDESILNILQSVDFSLYNHFYRFLSLRVRLSQISA